MDAFPAKNTQPETVDHVVTFVGGSSAVTKVYGPKVVVTRAGAGEYLLTWSENPGVLVGVTPGLRADTPADIKGHTVVFGEWSPTAWTLPVKFTGATETLHDLAALEWITVRATFAQTTELS